jgi:hypothetical protein
MSPGPQPEGGDARDVHMGHEPEGMIMMMAARDDGGERHKPADEDEDMSSPVLRDEAARGGGGVAGSGSREGARTTVGAPPGRRKLTRAEQLLSSTFGEIQEVDAWGPVGGKGPRWVEDSGLTGLGLEYSHMRVMTPAPSLYLQHGSRFVGTQQSERQRYDVEVEIKHVDMRESFLCGYLKIQGELLSPSLRLDSPSLQQS